MGEPQRIGWGKTSVEEEHAKQDVLLARIENEGLISGWCWSPMTETVGRLRALPEAVAWVATRYLQNVVVRGDAVFGAREHHQQTMFDNEHRPAIECRCGGDAPTDRPTRRGGRDVTVAICESCGMVLAMFDGEPYRERTLLAQGFH